MWSLIRSEYPIRYERGVSAYPSSELSGSGFSAFCENLKTNSPTNKSKLLSGSAGTGRSGTDTGGVYIFASPSATFSASSWSVRVHFRNYTSPGKIIFVCVVPGDGRVKKLKPDYKNRTCFAGGLSLRLHKVGNRTQITRYLRAGKALAKGLSLVFKNYRFRFALNCFVLISSLLGLGLHMRIMSSLSKRI